MNRKMQEISKQIICEDKTHGYKLSDIIIELY